MLWMVLLLPRPWQIYGGLLGLAYYELTSPIFKFAWFLSSSVVFLEQEYVATTSPMLVHSLLYLISMLLEDACKKLSTRENELNEIEIVEVNEKDLQSCLTVNAQNNYFNFEWSSLVCFSMKNELVKWVSEKVIFTIQRPWSHTSSVRIDGGLGGWTPHFNLRNPLF